MPVVIPGNRAISGLRSNYKATLRDRTDEFLRSYIGRKAIAMLTADAILLDRGGPANAAFSSTVAKILELVQPLALTSETEDEL